MDKARELAPGPTIWLVVFAASTVFASERLGHVSRRLGKNFQFNAFETTGETSFELQ